MQLSQSRTPRRPEDSRPSPVTPVLLSPHPDSPDRDLHSGGYLCSLCGPHTCQGKNLSLSHHPDIRRILLQFRRNIQKVLYKTPCLSQEEKHACNPRTRSCLNMGLSSEKTSSPNSLPVSLTTCQWLGLCEMQSMRTEPFEE